MWDLLKKNTEACGQFRDHLEAAAGAAPPARTLEDLFVAFPLPLRTHAAFCQECRQAAEELLSVRALLRALPAETTAPDAWFAPRVIAAIASREAEVRRTGTSWAAVPMLASRLALASAALLLVVSTWIYERPVMAPARTSSADSAQESLFEFSPPPANQDDILSSLAERPQ
jgi:hypothetical protein